MAGRSQHRVKLGKASSDFIQTASIHYKVYTSRHNKELTTQSGESLAPAAILAMDLDNDSSNLEDVEKALGELTINGARTSNAIHILANASRTSLEARQRLGKRSTLRALVETVECGINDSLDTVELALRCIGNACIDNGAAREEMAKIGFSWAKQCLPATDSDNDSMSIPPVDTSTTVLVAKVLYNICSDCDVAQQQCYREHVHYPLIRVCTFNAVFNSEHKQLVLELLFWICSHIQPDEEKPPFIVLSMLLTLPDLYNEHVEAEDFALLIETCLLFLREPIVQRSVVEGKLVNHVWRMLEYNEQRMASSDTNEDDRKLIVPLSTGLIWILSDLAAMPQFAIAYHLDNDWIREKLVPSVQMVNAHGNVPHSLRLVDAACQILGNLLWSNQELGKETLPQAIESLWQLVLSTLVTSEDAELLHSAAGLLVQLTRSSASVREALGVHEETAQVVDRLLKHGMPQLKQDGIVLVRALGKDSPANQERFANIANSNSAPTSDTAMGEP